MLFNKNNHRTKSNKLKLLEENENVIQLHNIYIKKVFFLKLKDVDLIVYYTEVIEQQD